MLIAADVGGTHARVALIAPTRHGDGTFDVLHYRKYVCADFPGLAAIIAGFRRDVVHAPVDQVALAIAGHVVDDTVVNVNLPWAVSVSGLREALGVRDLAIVNDFEAVAHAIGHIEEDDTLALSGTEVATEGPVLVVGPGTGLGAALRIPSRDGAVILATEAGQATLAPDTDLEFDLLRILRARGSRVLIEHVLSGTGLMNLAAAIRVLHGEPAIARTPAQISAAAIAGADPVAVLTIDVFCGWLGSVLGDLALLYGAQGGVYLAGGVLPQIKGLLQRSTFAQRFLDKGAMREALARTPVRLVDHAQLGVIGAAIWYFARDSNPVRAADVRVQTATGASSKTDPHEPASGVQRTRSQPMTRGEQS
ncbi:MAG: glucokinase [Lysobacterales bacterium]